MNTKEVADTSLTMEASVDRIDAPSSSSSSPSRKSTTALKDVGEKEEVDDEIVVGLNSSFTDFAPTGRASREFPDASATSSTSPVCRLCLLTEAEANERLIKLRCGCRGSVRFAHKSCRKTWIEARNQRTDCELCGGHLVKDSCCKKMSRNLVRFCHTYNPCRFWRNAGYKETFFFLTLLVFLAWLLCYCIYIFTSGIWQALDFEKQVRRGFHTISLWRRNYTSLQLEFGLLRKIPPDYEDRMGPRF